MTLSETVYLVRASAKSGNWIWVGGDQSKSLARAGYWHFEVVAQGVAESNQKKMDEELVSVYGSYRKNHIKFEVVPMLLKDIMIARLKG